MSNETNEILTIAGKRVRVEHAKFGDDTCAKCCFGDTDLCHGVDAVFPCERFDFETAYFVNADEIGVEYCEQNCKGFQETGRCFADGECDAKKAEEIEGISQEVTLIPSNEDEDEAAEMAARRAFPYEGGTKGDICEASIPIFCKGFKAGIAYERKRLMKEAVGCMFSFTEDKTPCLLIGDGYALRVNAKKGDYFVAIIIKKEK